MHKRTMIGILLASVAWMAVEQEVRAQDDRIRKLEQRVKALEQRVSDADSPGSTMGGYLLAAFSLLALAWFCGLWARSTGRDFWLWFVGGVLFNFLALIVLYWVVPPVRVPLRQLWPSAALASVAIELLIKAFAFYAARTTANSVYGPLGALFTFLLLIYLLGTVLLLGAELIAAGASRHKGRRTDAQRQLPPK